MMRMQGERVAHPCTTWLYRDTTRSLSPMLITVGVHEIAVKKNATWIAPQNHLSHAKPAQGRVLQSTHHLRLASLNGLCDAHVDQKQCPAGIKKCTGCKRSLIATSILHA